MPEVHADLVHRYDERLELIEAEATCRTAALRSKLTEMEQRAEAAVAALVSTQTELASVLSCFFFNSGSMTPSLLHGRTEKKFFNGGCWSTCTAPCSKSSGTGPTRP